MKKYKDTLNLPKTDFPIKAKADREVELVSKWEREKTYEQIQARRTSASSFTLHDGPPYANGHIHHGHILNKVLKDIVVKHKNLTSRPTSFIPGWDCHGLPIEQEVDKKLGPARHGMDKVELRNAYREYAAKFVDIQREEFKRLGILADWEHPYKTMDIQYEADTLYELAKFAEAGLLYRDYKPVFWCPNHLTALAQNDIEYKEDHVSNSVFVLFPMEFRGDNEFLAVWTTTPWTLSVNKAVAVSHDASYSLIEVGHSGIRIWIATDLINSVSEKCFAWKGWAELERRTGNELTKEKYVNPLTATICPIVVSDHVTTTSGTGFVHIAPAHGEDDFRLGKQYNLDIESAVGPNGKNADGLNLEQLNEHVIERFKGLEWLLAVEPYTHKYPYSARTHKPVIVKATHQWFINIDKPFNDGKSLRERALEAIKEVSWLPEHGYNRIKGMLETRPDWCISRQRTWGVPIPAWHCDGCDYIALDAEYIEIMAADRAIDIERTNNYNTLDDWFSEENTTDIVCPECGAKGTYHKESDILDVWFDSGVSNACVMSGKQVDLYLEGSDQHRGWFQSTLLAALGARELVPYKTVLTHGFVVDDKGEKLSKSKKNYVDPFKFIGKDGAEILRLWVASSDYRSDIKVSQEILNNLKQTQHKIRNTIRYMVAAVADYPGDYDQDMEQLDAYIMMLWYKTYNECMEAYESYNFHRVVRAVENFCVNDLSSFYFDAIKDTLYCDAKSSAERRSAQAALDGIVRSMVKLMSPIMSFSMEDAWKALGENESVFLATAPTKHIWFDEKLVERYNLMREWKQLANVKLEQLRDAKEIGSNLDANIVIEMPLDYLDFGWNHRLLAKIFGVSQVEVKLNQDVSVEAKKADGPQCQRCWSYIPLVKDTDVCERCNEVLNESSVS